MEIDDLDLQLDPVAGFLQTKLDHIRSLKDETRETVSGLKDLLSRLQKETLNCEDEPKVRIVESWKKICAGKFVFGFKIENATNQLLENLSVSLEFNPAISPLYSLRVYSNTAKAWTNSIDESCQLILVVEKPKFFKQTLYRSSGVLLYTSSQSLHQIKLPAITLEVEDFFKRLDTKSIDLISGDVASFLCVFASFASKRLFMHLPDNSQRSLENYFVIDCMFREVKFQDVTYFLVDGVSASIDGILLTFRQDNQDNVYALTIHYKFEENLHAIVHYLHVNVRSANILAYRLADSEEASSVFPAEEEFVSQRPREIDSDVEQFAESLQRQIDAMSNFQKYVVEGKPGGGGGRDISEDYRNLRKLANRNEMETDLLFEKLNSRSSIV